PSIMKSPWAKLTTRMTPKISARPMLIRAYTPPTSRPVATYWTSSARTTAAGRPRLLVPGDGAGGNGRRRHRVGLAVLPLDDERRGPHAPAAPVELHVARVERADRRPRRDVDLRQRVADGLGVGRFRLLDGLLDEPDVRVRAERVLGHERLTRPLLELLHELVLALHGVGGHD